MDKVNIKLHKYQVKILANLSTEAGLKFNKLLIDGLESEHMNYHLKRLLDIGLVQKDNNRYFLTDAGKDYVSYMSDDVEFVEKQPKTSVLLHVVRKDESGKIFVLLSKRLKHPYYGKIGRLTGKVKFGETLMDASRRELYEETGLQSESMVLERIWHKIGFNKRNECVQDSLFYRFFIKDTYGNFIEKTPYQHNLWLSKEDLLNKEKFDFFDDLEIDERYEPENLSFTEDILTVDDF